MTADEFSAQLPPLSNDTIPIKPPFVFKGMSARVFPLRASLDALQQICDANLNIIPPEAGRFRVPAPYVVLMVLDYGQVAQAVTGIGWYSQIEVFFSIPVEWYKLVDGKWSFHDWAVLTPYIFVTDAYSVLLGRTVYGFPKILANMTPAKNYWIADPMSPITLARLETAVFPGVYEGKRLETKVFLEIERDAPMQNFRVPPDPSSPLMPWVIASNVARSMGDFGRSAMWMAQAMNVFRTEPGVNPAALPEMFARVMAMFQPGGSGFGQNSLNMKQFRRADAPERICYQSLTNGSMVLTGFNGGGLLGEERNFAGDLSGGHTVRLYDHSSLPIVRTMGLEINRQWAGDDGAVIELKPLLPFWINLDLLYQQGENIAWRTENGIWRDGSGAVLGDPSQNSAPSQHAKAAQNSAAMQCHAPAQPAAPDQNNVPGPQFGSATNSAVEAVTGPFQFSRTTVRVLPLLARLDSLQAYLKSFANQALQDPILREDGKPEKVQLSVWARPKAIVAKGESPIGGDFAYVYLTVSSFAEVTSKTNNVGDWAKYELSFMIPVKWERDLGAPTGSPEDWKTVGVGLVPAFTFVDDCIAAISRSEVQGIDAATATFVRPESVWLQEGEPKLDAKQSLLRVDAEVWPAFGVGQESRSKTIVQISQRVPNAGLGNPESRDVPFLWAETLDVELATKKGTKATCGSGARPKANPDYFKIARALSLELLGARTPFALYAMKQFRDVHSPDKACYQEILRIPRGLKEVFDVREIDETLVVDLHDFPSLKIVETLGIIAPAVLDTGSGIVHSAQAIRPFYIHATIDEPLAERLLVRSGKREWTLSATAFDSILSDSKGSPPIIVDLNAEADQNGLDSAKIMSTMFHARDRLRHHATRKPVLKEDARTALKFIDAQMIVESVLSREWGSADENARWRLGRRELLKAVNALPDAGMFRPITESKLYRMLNNLLALRPGAVASRLEVKGLEAHGVHTWKDTLARMINRQFEFAKTALDLEKAYNTVAPLFLLGEHQFSLAAEEIKGAGPSDPEFEKAANQIFESLKHLRDLELIPKPFDGPVLAKQTRLKELINYVLDNWKDIVEVHPIAGMPMQHMLEILDLARAQCGAQREIILSKLSRAYQKPDFCIRRDCVGSGADELLPLALSWDENWYFGEAIKLDDVAPDAAPNRPKQAALAPRDPGPDPGPITP